MEECLGVNGIDSRFLYELTVIWKSESTWCWCGNALLYNTFHGRQCNFRNGFIRL